MKTANRILLVEDNTDDYALIKRAFKKCGLEDSLAWMKSGKEAVKFLSEPESAASVALIVSDIKMAKVNGFEFHSWVQSKPALTSIPCVLAPSGDCGNHALPHEAFEIQQVG
jgi:CheY-like chemotaxis protein